MADVNQVLRLATIVQKLNEAQDLVNGYSQDPDCRVYDNDFITLHRHLSVLINITQKMSMK